VNVTWHDATAFCQWLSQQEGRRYRLPHENEWEYACRAGTTTKFWCGEDDASLRGKANLADQALRPLGLGGELLPWDDGFALTAPTGVLPANPWGLCDMHGNVWEWCLDAYAVDAYLMPGVAREENGSGSASRVIRGASWLDASAACRSANRAFHPPTHRSIAVGFRVMCEP
jgi:formylglycine-generating enzyme required for sulfatase activity